MTRAAADEADALLLLVNAAHKGIRKIEQRTLTPADLTAMGVSRQRQINLPPESSRQKIRMMRQQQRKFICCNRAAGRVEIFFGHDAAGGGIGVHWIIDSGDENLPAMKTKLTALIVQNVDAILLQNSADWRSSAQMLMISHAKPGAQWQRCQQWLHR